MSAEIVDPDSLDVWADSTTERFWTPATVVTFLRTIAAVTLVAVAIHQGPVEGEFWSQSLKTLCIALAVFWIGDSLDGQLARRMHHETRIGATLDIMSDRLCASAFYFGLAWLHPEFTVPVLLYLAEYMVIDFFLSIAFLGWKIRSPNYFWVVDRTIYRFNWTHPAKAANSGLFAVLLLLTRAPWLGAVIAAGLLTLKLISLARLTRIGLPIPQHRGTLETEPAA